MQNKKFLFITSHKIDYSEDLLFSGLVKILGKKNVISYPQNIKFYFPRKKYPGNIAFCKTLFNMPYDRFVSLKDIDYIVISSIKKDTFKNYLFIEPKLSKNIPLIIIDGGDHPDILGDAHRLHFDDLAKEILKKRKIDIIFKREYLKNKTYEQNVYPFPLSFKNPFPTNFVTINKKYDVVFWAGNSHPTRNKAFDIINSKFDTAQNGSIKNPTLKNHKRTGKFYLQELASAKIAYNFRGGGWDTLRYWEIPGVATFMISGKPQILIPNNYIQKKHIIFCKDDLSDLINLTNYFLKHDKEREDIAQQAYLHTQKYHTNVQRAKYFLNILRKY